MKEEKTLEVKEEATNKLQSRKFIVWLVWLVLTVIVIAFCTATMIVTKQIVAELTSLIEKTLTWFFSISMMYLGVNAGQKIGCNIAEAIVNKQDKE